jgi:hypothetical protein
VVGSCSFSTLHPSFSVKAEAQFNGRSGWKGNFSFYTLPLSRLEQKAPVYHQSTERPLFHTAQWMSTPHCTNHSTLIIARFGFCGLYPRSLTRSLFVVSLKLFPSIRKLLIKYSLYEWGASDVGPLLVVSLSIHMSSHYAQSSTYSQTSFSWVHLLDRCSVH